MCADVYIHAQKDYSICCQVHKPAKAPADEEQEFDASHVVETIQEKTRQKSGLMAANIISMASADHGKEATEISCSSSIILEEDQNIQSALHPAVDPIISSTDSCGYESTWQSNPDVEPPMDSSQQMEPNQFASKDVLRSFADTNGDWSAVYTGDHYPEPQLFSCSFTQPNETEAYSGNVNHKFTSDSEQQWHWDNSMNHPHDTNGEIYSNPQITEDSFDKPRVDFSIENTNVDWDGKYQTGLTTCEPFASVVQFHSPEQLNEFQLAPRLPGCDTIPQSSDHCCNEDEEVPIARDSSQIKSVCEAHGTLPTFLRAPIQHCAEVNPSQIESETGQSAVNSDPIQSDGQSRDNSEGLEEILRALSARLATVESDLESTKNELKTVRYCLQYYRSELGFGSFADRKRT